MDSFYLIVLSIATVILILILAYIGMKLRNKSVTQAFPPQANSCPDYWGFDGSYCYIPKNGGKNTGSIYSADGKVTLNVSNTPGYNSDSATDRQYIYFGNTGWTVAGKTSDCQKRQWASQTGLMWDGITNFNGC